LQPPPASFSPPLKISRNTESDRERERERERERGGFHGGARQAKKEE
jgi:hypothetical protein